MGGYSIPRVCHQKHIPPPKSPPSLLHRQSDKLVPFPLMLPAKGQTNYSSDTNVVGCVEDVGDVKYIRPVNGLNSPQTRPPPRWRNAIVCSGWNGGDGDECWQLLAHCVCVCASGDTGNRATCDGDTGLALFGGNDRSGLGRHPRSFDANSQRIYMRVGCWPTSSDPPPPPRIIM